MMKKIALLIGCLLFGVTVLLWAAPGARLYVVNALSQDVSVIDAATETVLTHIPLGARGYSIALSPTKDKAYITVSPGTDIAEMPAKGASQSGLLVLDLAKQQVEQEIPLEISPLASVHVAPKGDLAYVVTAAEPGIRNMERGRVLFVDLKHQQITRTVNVGLNPLDSAMTPDGKTLYTADWASRSISVIDLREGRLEDTIPLGSYPARKLAMHPGGKTLYAVQEAAAPVVTEYANNLNGSVRNYVFNNAPVQQVQQYNAQAFIPQALPRSEDSILLEMDTTTGKMERYPLEGISPVNAIAVAADGTRLYAYGRAGRTITMMNTPPAPRGPQGTRGQQGRTQLADAPQTPQSAQQADQLGPQQRQQAAAQSAPAALVTTDAYDLQVFDLAKKRVVSHLGNYGYLSTMMLSPDGSKIYLVGTPGDPALEAAVQHSNDLRARRIVDNLYNNTYQSNGNVMSKDGGSRGQPLNSKGGSAPSYETDVSEMMADLARLPKTVTVLDTKTGKPVKTLTVGSLPQGCKMLVP